MLTFDGFFQKYSSLATTLAPGRILPTVRGAIAGIAHLILSSRSCLVRKAWTTPMTFELLEAHTCVLTVNFRYFSCSFSTQVAALASSSLKEMMCCKIIVRGQRTLFFVTHFEGSFELEVNRNPAHGNCSAPYTAYARMLTAFVDCRSETPSDAAWVLGHSENRFCDHSVPPQTACCRSHVSK
jgi:hypothetical protein